MAAKVSAGLVMYRRSGPAIEFLLLHPGGPLHARKDAGSWTIPKGEPEQGEELLATAQREFEEETGVKPEGPFIPLGFIRQKGGKIVHAWALEGNCDPHCLRSNTFTMEWPPNSGSRQEFPELDRAEFFDLETARVKANPAQVALLERATQAVLQAK
jgi:predicted NUDIX family NTP pyrophosphohydrolase